MNVALQDQWKDIESNTASEIASQRGKALVNYLFIYKNKSSRFKNDDICSIQLESLDKVYKNAKRYSDDDFIVWLDLEGAAPETKFFIDSHYDLLGPENVKFKNLRDLPEYHAMLEDIDRMIECVWSAKHYPKIWYQVDLVRLVVLRHCLENTELD